MPLMKKWTWRDVEDIALDLVAIHPHLDPLAVKLSELKRMITELPSFGDNPDVVSDKTLEAIQAAWYDEYED
jgi:FeS assembly protein IscX